jgi:carboxyl-terminal processing protease
MQSTMKKQVLVHFATLVLPVLASYLGLLLTTELEVDWQWSLLLVVPCLLLAARGILRLPTLWAACAAGFCIGFAFIYAIEAVVSYREIEVSPYWYLMAPAFAAVASTVRYLADRHRYTSPFSAYIPHQIFTAAISLSLLAMTPPILWYLVTEKAIGHAPNSDLALIVEVLVPGYKLDDKKYFRLLFADHYFFFRPERLNDARMARDVSGTINTMVAPADRWSGIVPPDKSRLRRQASKKIGVTKMRLEADGHIILQVSPKSPAAEAGLQRGDKVIVVGGVRMTDLDNETLTKFGSKPISVDYISRDGAIKSVVVRRNDHPSPFVWAPLSFDVAGKKVGYVAYDQFDPQADSALVSAMQTLAEKNLSELILDLRYNPGGDVPVLDKVAAMLVSKDGVEKLAYRYEKRNRFNYDTEDRYFAAASLRPVAAPSRLIVITSEHSCSASEALIQILQPYMQVVTIGSKTCGKHVGGTVYPRPSAELRLITFRLHNARGEAVSPEGIEPTCAAEDDVRFPRGDPRESSLAEALFFIRSGHCSTAKQNEN